MKKLTIVVLSVILMIGLFVSCSNEVQQQEPIAYITFNGDGSRAISSTNQGLPGVSELHWKYTAVKQDRGLKTGEALSQEDVNTGKGLTGSVGPLSIGSWKFTLYGYKDSALVYQGETIETLSAGETKTIAVDIKYAGSSDNGFVEVQGLTLKNNESAVTGNAGLAKLILSATRQDQEGSIEETVLLINAKGNFNTPQNEKISVAPGVYQFTFTFKDALDRVVSDIQSKYILILGGQTTTLSGDVNEYKQQASFDAKNYYEQFGNHFYVVMNDATGLNATQEAARKYSEKHEGLETYIYLNDEIVTNGSSINFSSAEEANSRDISSSTKVANITLILNGNTIKHESETAPALVINNEGLTLTIKDDTNLGSVTSTGKGIVVNSGNLKIEGGNISSASTALSVKSDACVQFNGGKINVTGSSTVAIENNGDFRMDGGEIKASTAIKVMSVSAQTILNTGKIEATTSVSAQQNVTDVTVVISNKIEGNVTVDQAISNKVINVKGAGTEENPYSIDTFADLKNSIAISEGECFIVLNADIIADESLEIVDKTLTIDFNNHKISAPNIVQVFDIFGKSDVTIWGDGTIEGPSGEVAKGFDSNSVIKIEGPSAKLTFETGKLTAGGVGSDGMYGIYVLNGGTVVLGNEFGEGPTIETWFACVGENNTTSPANLKIYAGSYTCLVAPNDTDWWTYFCAPIYAASSGNINILGGTFNGYYSLSSRYVNVAQNIVITGGEFNGTKAALFIDTKNGSPCDSTRSITISGGTFSSEITGNLKEGYICKNIPENKYSVVPSSNWIDSADTTWYDEKKDSYTIESASQLAGVAKLVNDGKTNFFEKTITLKNDIDLSGKEWTPIGKAKRNGKVADGKSFCGIFDGQNYEIKGLTIGSSSNEEKRAVGLFGAVNNGNIRNINFTSVSINTPSSDTIGTAVGFMYGGGSVSNITVAGNIYGKEAGGIVGRLIVEGTIENCINNATITTIKGGLGGILGKPYYSEEGKIALIKNCKNYGKLSSNGSCVGGISGLAAAYFESCENYGNITSTDYGVGGIVGDLKRYGKVEDCINTGNITCLGSNNSYGVGGIVGWIRYDETDYNYQRTEIISVTNNYNSGSIYSSSINGVGGIIGHIQNVAIVTGNISDAPSVTGPSFVSGIVGTHQKVEGSKFSNKLSLTKIQDNTMNTPEASIIGDSCVSTIVYINDPSVTDVQENKTLNPKQN